MSQKIYLILIQSEQLGLAISVSSSLRPKKNGGRRLIRWGNVSSTPTGTYRYKKESHSSKKRRVVSTPWLSEPQCSRP